MTFDLVSASRARAIRLDIRSLIKAAVRAKDAQRRISETTISGWRSSATVYAAAVTPNSRLCDGDRSSRQLAAKALILAQTVRKGGLSGVHEPSSVCRRGPAAPPF